MRRETKKDNGKREKNSKHWIEGRKKGRESIN